MARLAGGAREGAPSPAAARAIEAVRRHLDGDRADLGAVELDMSAVPEPNRRVYGLLREVEPGSRITYGELARQAGPPVTARSVGAAMARNPYAVVVPCHRVVAADGRLGGFSASGGTATKLRLLALERGPGLGTGTAPPYDLDEAVEHLRAADSVMARVIDEQGSCTLRSGTSPSVFAALVHAVVFQQLNGRAAGAIHARLLALLDARGGDPEPRALLLAPDGELRAAGLSRTKIAALQDLARLTTEGAVPTIGEADGLTDEAFVERVRAVRGVGPWTAQMLLIFLLGRPDVLPTDDFGVRSGFRTAYGTDALPTATELHDAGERWSPFRSVASWYLWRVAEADATRSA